MLRVTESFDDVALGAWIKLPGVQSPEILADAGFDFCIVDMEHTLLEASSVETHLVVGRALGMSMFVRTPDKTPSLIQKLLDGGADGVVVPHVDTVTVANEIAASSLFPPLGTRGSGGTSRAGMYGKRRREEYLAGSGGVVAQIESVESVLSVANIASTEGINALLLGNADLDLDPRRSKLGSRNEIAEKVIDAGHAAGIPVGTACAPEAATTQREVGFDFLVCANDATLMSSAAHAIIDSLKAER